MHTNRAKWLGSLLKFSPSTARRITRAVIDPLEPRQLLTGVTAWSPYNGQQQVALGSNVTVTFDVNMNASTINTNTLQLRNADNNPVAAAVSYNAATRVATLNPAANLVAGNSFYYVKVMGGAAGVTDTAGMAMTADVNFAFTTGTPVFNDTTVFSGLTSPSNIQFAPDGKVFVAEKSGLIKVFDSVTDTTADVFADLRTQVHNYWDRGLLGLAIDPNFTNGRPYVYVLYTFDAAIGQAAPVHGTPGVSSDPGNGVPAGTGAIVSGRLSRLTASGNQMVAGSELVLINDWSQQFPSHSVGEIQFGPDGMLYASAGDGASFNGVDYGQFPGINDPANEGGALRAQDIRTSGDPTGLNGSVIRINPDTGAAAPGNPNTTGDANAKRIIAYGMRNPFRFTFRPDSSELWIGDVGWNNWEEINRIVSPTDGAVENFGWPAYEGSDRQSGYDAANLAMLESLYTTPDGHTLPWFGYRHSEKVVAGSGEPTGGSSISGLAFYNGGQYPSAYDGALFFSDYSRKQIYVMYRGPNGLPDPATRQIFKSQANGSVYLTMGPDGDLFYVDMDLGRVGRFTFDSNNATPTARITASQTSGPAPMTVTFSAATSTDPDAGDTLTYAWDLDGDGAFDDSTLAAPGFTYTTTGDRTVKLRVTDRGGLTNTANLVISVNAPPNTAPTPVINLPLSSLHWKVGDTITFSGGATDTQDGALAASRLSWTLAMIHGNYTNPDSQHTHVIQTFSGVSGGSFVAPDHESPSWLELRLTATDEGGLSSTTVVRLDPQTTQISLAANVGGVLLTLNSEQLATPFSRAVITSGQNTVSAPGSVTVSGTTYNFSGWSDGGAITHNFVAPDQANLTLTAHYTAATGAHAKLGGTIIGTAGSFQGSGATRDNAFDGSLSTFFDGPEALDGNGMWVGLDLGGPTRISQIRFAPRAGWGSRMVGGVFQASNTADFSSGVVNLHTIAGAPPEVQYTTVVIGDSSTYRYVRYLSPNAGWGNVAEIEFYTPSGAITAPARPTGLTATPVSTTRIDLAWNDVAINEAGYRIERRTGAGAFSVLATINSPNAGSYSDTTAVAGGQYTYRVTAFNDAGSASSAEASATAPASNPALEKLSGTVIGTPGSYAGLSNTREKAFDGNLATFFDGPDDAGNGMWTGLDLGAARRIVQLRFAPRATWSVRMIGGVFQGSNSADFADATTLYTVPAAPPEGIYQTIAISNPTAFRYVRFLGGDASYGNVAEIEFYTLGAPLPTPPAAPGGLAVTSVTPVRVSLSWTDTADNETGFRIQRKHGAGGTYITLATINAPNTSSYNDNTLLAPNTQYYYRVLAFNAGGDSGLSNEVVATTPAGSVSGFVVRELWSDVSGNTINSIPVNTLPTSVSALNALEIPVNDDNNSADRIRGFIQAPATGTYTFWIAGDDASQLWLSTSSDPAGKQLIASIGNWTDSREWGKYASQKSAGMALQAGQQYYFEVLHKQGGGGSNLAVGWAKPGESTAAPSEVIPGTVLNHYNQTAVSLETPTALTATATGATAVQLNWTDNANNEAGYRIERSIDGGAWAEIALVEANVTAYTNAGLTPSTAYAYRVRAYLDANLSSYSPAAGVTTPAAPGLTTTYLSDLAFTTLANGWGAVERDQSNGEIGAGDGQTITLNGVTYAKGLGAHGYSEIVVDLDGQYDSFISDIGVDDEVGSVGSVTFEVWADGVKLFGSDLMTGDSVTQTVNVSVAGCQQLKLIVTDGGFAGIDSDHGDWAGARLIKN